MLGQVRVSVRRVFPSDRWSWLTNSCSYHMVGVLVSPNLFLAGLVVVFVLIVLAESRMV